MPLPALLTAPLPGPIGPIVMAFVSAENEIRITWSPDGFNWTVSAPVLNGDSFDLQRSKAAPALCMFGGVYYMVYVANDDTNQLYVTTSPDGFVWSFARHVMGGHGSPKQASKAAPALTATAQYLILTYVADNDSRELFLTSSSDGIHWAHTTATPGRLLTVAAPTLLNNSMTE